MEYFIPFTAFFTTLFAIKGGAWDARQIGHRKLTKAGYVTVIFACIVLIVSLLVLRDKITEAEDASKMLSEAVLRAKDLKTQSTKQFAQTTEQSKTQEHLLSVAREENATSQHKLKNTIDALREANDNSQETLKKKVDALNERNKDLFSENKELGERLSRLRQELLSLVDKNLLLQETINKSVKIAGEMKDTQDKEAGHIATCRDLARNQYSCAGNACGTTDALQRAGCY